MLSMKQAIINVFTKYATFKGRARRSEFWWFRLFESIIFALIMIIEVINGLTFAPPFNFFGPISLLVSLIVFLPDIALSIRRLHDINKSGSWYLAYYVVNAALAGSFVIIDDLRNIVSSRVSIAFILLYILYLAYAILIIAWFCKDSDKEPNRYGESPKYYDN